MFNEAGAFVVIYQFDRSLVLLNDLNLEFWSHNIQAKLNIYSCGIMLYGKSNDNSVYSMNNGANIQNFNVKSDVREQDVTFD